MKRIEQLNGYYSQFGWTQRKPKGLRQAKRSDLEGRTIVSAQWLDGNPIITLDDGRQITIGVRHRVVHNQYPTEKDTGPKANNNYDLMVAITRKPVPVGDRRISPYERRMQMEKIFAEIGPFPEPMVPPPSGKKPVN